MPTRQQLDRGREVASRARKRLEGTMDVLYVMPDYYSDRPRACMDGWARRFVHVTPSGKALPCHAAESIPGLTFESLRDKALGDIWQGSPAMRAFRGDAWMKEPCRSCPSKLIDFGGCRCQAFLLTGDAAAADPACSLSPHHSIIEAARVSASATPRALPLIYRGLARP
jgi:pyrroloquinoline quinone biosynthesis protein E